MKGLKIELITSRENECIKRIKKLHDKKYRDELQCFLIEGAKIVEELLNYCPENANTLIFSQESTERYRELYEKALEYLKLGKIKKIFQASEKIVRYISTTTTSQGIYAEVSFRNKDFNLLKGYNSIVVIDSIQDPGNLGTIIRSIDAFGFGNAVILEGTVDVYNPKVIRSSMGSIFHIDLFKDIDKAMLMDLLKENAYKIYVTTPYGDVDISDLKIDKRFAVIIGNESKGVNEYFMDKADQKVMISMTGKAESLNAAIAASIVLYELNKKQKPSS